MAAGIAGFRPREQARLRSGLCRGSRSHHTRTPEPLSVDPVDYVDQLHRLVDELTASLVLHHRARLQCSVGCSDCCVDDITVFEVEAELIRRRAPEVLVDAPGGGGGCAFLDEDQACRIYEHRPYVCRTHGLPLRWLDEDADDVFEARDICELNATAAPLAALLAERCWTIGPVGARLRGAQGRYGLEEERVALRALFSGAGRTER